MLRFTWRITGVCALAIGLAFAPACGGSEEPDVDVSAAGVEEEAKETVDAAASYAASQRRQLEQRAQRMADQVERELADARAELAELEGDARARLDAAIDRAESAREDVADELDDLQQAGADGWREAGDRLAAALDEMDEARREVTAALTDAGADTAGTS